MSDTGELLNISRETIHIAISFIDIALSNWDVPKIKNEFMGATCLLIAAKFIEKEDKIP